MTFEVFTAVKNMNCGLLGCEAVLSGFTTFLYTGDGDDTFLRNTGKHLI
jgi:hypothetical protein